MKAMQNLYKTFLLPAAVVFVALMLRYLSAHVPILDTRFFYWPEEAGAYFLSLTASQSGQVQAVALVDLFAFIPLYWLQLRVLSAGDRPLPGKMRALAFTSAFFDAVETILILSLLGGRTAAPIVATVALSVSTSLKWLSLGGWLSLFVLRRLGGR